VAAVTEKAADLFADAIEGMHQDVGRRAIAACFSAAVVNGAVVTAMTQALVLDAEVRRLEDLPQSAQNDQTIQTLLGKFYEAHESALECNMLMIRAYEVAS